VFVEPLFGGGQLVRAIFVSAHASSSHGALDPQGCRGPSKASTRSASEGLSQVSGYRTGKGTIWLQTQTAELPDRRSAAPPRRGSQQHDWQLVSVQTGAVKASGVAPLRREPEKRLLSNSVTETLPAWSDVLTRRS